MTREEARELLQTTPIDIRSPRDDLSPADYFKALNMAIEALQERPKGRWKQFQDFKHLKECSECGYIADFTYKFCNECGADMRDNEEQDV